MSGNISDFQLGGAFKPMQRGVISLTSGTGTATITAVDTTKARLRHLGLSAGSSTVYGNGTLVLTNSTTITATITTGSGAISWELEELY